MNNEALAHSVRFLQSWLPLRYAREQIPGFVVGVAHQGTPLLLEAYGHADVERGTALRPDHIFRIASHSKTFTGTALMLLVEDGRIRLDDRVAAHLPWLSDAGDPRWREVTVRQLLSHGAGVIRDGVEKDYWHLSRAFPDAEALRRELLATGLVLDPNVQMKYSNYGYSLLGMVVEAVSGMPYNRFVTERIIRPLGLSDTYPEYAPELDGRLATGYGRRERGTRRPIAHVSTHGMSAATGFCATASDLLAYFTAHMVGSGRLLQDASKREMQRVEWHAHQPGQPSRTDYGLGLILDQVGDRHLFGHSGGFPGFITRSMADPKDELVVVALTNCVDGPASAISDAVWKIIDHFQTHDGEGGPAPDLARYEGHYTNLWGTTSIVALGDRLVAAHPDSWEPFASVETLERGEGEDTFVIAETSSFGSAGEPVRFQVRDGRVETVDYTGTIMWPDAVWLERNA